MKLAPAMQLSGSMLCGRAVGRRSVTSHRDRDGHEHRASG
jgi:hypothetical protein